MLDKAVKKYRGLPVQVRASFWFLICSFLQQGISVITTPIFTRLLNTAEYGQYNVFNSWMGVASIFVTLNLSYGVYTQGLVKFDGDKTFSSSLQGLTVLLCAAWTSIYLAFRDFFNAWFTLTTVQMLCMLVMMWTTAVFSFWAAEQRVYFRYRTLVIVTAIVSVLKPVIGIVFVMLADDKVTARVLGLALVQLAGYTWCFFVQMHRGKKFFSARYWKYALAFNLPLVPHYLSQTVLNSADRIMIGSMVGSSEAGIYGLAYSLGLVMTLFNSALSNTMGPWMYQKIKAKKYGDIEPVAYSTLVAIALLNLLLIALAPEAVAIFAPPEYYAAIYVVPPVAMSVYFMYAYDLLAKYAFYYEKTRLIMVASVLGAVLNVVLNWLLIPVLGYVVAGYVTLICYVCYCVFHYLLMNRVCDECCGGVRPYDLKKLLAITVIFMIAGFALMATYAAPLLRYAILAAAVVTAVIKRGAIAGFAHDMLSKRKEGKA